MPARDRRARDRWSSRGERASNSRIAMAVPARISSGPIARNWSPSGLATTTWDSTPITSGPPGHVERREATGPGAVLDERGLRRADAHESVLGSRFDPRQQRLGENAQEQDRGKDRREDRVLAAVQV